MNILFVSAILPYPLHSGGQIRIYNLLQQLSKSHSISLFSFIRDETERKYEKDLGFLRDVTMIQRGRGMQLKYLMPSIFGSQPLLLSTYDNSMMRTAISEATKTRHFDLIHIEPFYVFPSLPKTSLPVVVSEHNVEHEVYMSFAGKVKTPLLKQFQVYDAKKLYNAEREILKSATGITAVSDDDALKIKKMTGRSDVSVISNGVDTTHFVFEKKTFKKKKQSFVFIGNFLWLPNIDVLKILLLKIWPAIRVVNPQAVLHIVGAHIPKWAAKHISDGVIFDGIVSDIRDAYRNADALIAPLTIAGGTKFKILEAFASGCPVITTPEGISGISGNVKDCVVLASNPSEIAAIILDMPNREKALQEMCSTARRLVETEYSWPNIATKLSDVWKEACV